MSEVERFPSYSAREGPLWRRYLIDSMLAILGSLLITTIIFALHLYPSIPNISLTYILLVLAFSLPLFEHMGYFAARGKFVADTIRVDILKLRSNVGRNYDVTRMNGLPDARYHSWCILPIDVPAMYFVKTHDRPRHFLNPFQEGHNVG